MSAESGMIQAKVRFFENDDYISTYGSRDGIFHFHDFHKKFIIEGEEKEFFVGGKYYYGDDKNHYPSEEIDCLIELVSGEIIKKFLIIGEEFDICAPPKKIIGMQKIGRGIIIDIS